MQSATKVGMIKMHKWYALKLVMTQDIIVSSVKPCMHAIAQSRCLPYLPCIHVQFNNLLYILLYRYRCCLSKRELCITSFLLRGVHCSLQSSLILFQLD